MYLNGEAIHRKGEINMETENFEMLAKDLGVRPEVFRTEFEQRKKNLTKEGQKELIKDGQILTVDQMAVNATKRSIFINILSRKLPAMVYIVGQGPTKIAESERKTKYKTVYLIVDCNKSAGLVRRRFKSNEDYIIIKALQWSSQNYPTGYYVCNLEIKEDGRFNVLANVEPLEQALKHKEDFGIELSEFDISGIDPTRIMRIVRRYPVRSFNNKRGGQYETVSIDMLTKTPGGTVEQIIASSGSTKVWGKDRLDEGKTYKVIVLKNGNYYNFDGGLEIVEPDKELDEAFKTVTLLTFGESSGESNLVKFKILSASDVKKIQGKKDPSKTFEMRFFNLLVQNGDGAPEIISASTFNEEWFKHSPKDELYEGKITKSGNYNTVETGPKVISGDISLENLKIQRIMSFGNLTVEDYPNIIMLIGYPGDLRVSERSDGSTIAFSTLSDDVGYEIEVVDFSGEVLTSAADSEGKLPGIIGVIGQLKDYKGKTNVQPLKIVQAEGTVEDIGTAEEVWV